MAKESRIEVLDSYRFIAILSVMLYHYYSRWTPPNNNVSLYPYGSTHDYFSYGWLGVQFFFIISGFVIAFTLTRTDGFVEFWKKRLIRLLPTMFICSLVTLGVFCLIDNKMLFPESHSIKNFFYSITLLSPELINKLFLLKIHGNYINGSYWSLWPEIQFYLVASCIYFINRKNFVRNIAIFTIAYCILDYITARILINVQTTNLLNLNISDDFIHRYNRVRTTFNYVDFSLYFLMGVLFFQLYLKSKTLMSAFFLVASILLLLFLNSGFNYSKFMPVHTIFLMVFLFIGFIYYSKQLRFLAQKDILSVGVASYSLYLIHESVGVLLINKYACLFGEYDFIFPVFIILLMISFSLISYKYVEKPIGVFLKNRFVKL